jgi:hypothetical protein
MFLEKKEKMKQLQNTSLIGVKGTKGGKNFNNRKS